MLDLGGGTKGAALFLDAMKILIWVVRILVFFCFFVFALQNTELVTMRLLPGQSWQAPLVIVLLLFFALGAVLGVISLLGLVFKQRREILRLKQQSRVSETKAEQAP